MMHVSSCIFILSVTAYTLLAAPTETGRMVAEKVMGKVLFNTGENVFEDENATVVRCDLKIGIYEIYNSTQLILSDIRNAVPNITIWKGGMTFVPVDGYFAEHNRTENNNNATNADIDNNSTTNLSGDMLVGVPPSYNETFKTTLELLGVGYKDLEYNLCVRYLDSEKDYLEKEENRTKSELEFTFKFAIPAHITTSVYPGIFYNIFIDTPPHSAEAAIRPETFVKTQFSTLQIAPPFSYYIRHDYNTGLIKLEHGAVTHNDLFARWAWVATVGNNNDDYQGYNLVHQKEPNRNVVISENGDLMLSSSEKSDENLIFTLNFIADKLSVWTVLDNETYCLVQFFASTLRLMAVPNADKNPESELCTCFKLQIGEVNVASAHHNTTFIDLYSTQSSELIGDDGSNNNKNDEPIEKGKEMMNFMDTYVDTTAILYFTSQPSTLQLFLTGRDIPTPWEDLKNIADGYFEKGTVCGETLLEMRAEIKPVLTCKLPYRHHQQKVVSGNNSTTPIVNSETTSEDVIYRKNLIHETKVQLFKNYMRFQFLADGVVNCENEENTSMHHCTGKVVIMCEKVVKDILNSMGVGYSNVIRSNEDKDGENEAYFYYWSEGVITYSNSTVAPVYYT